MQPLHHICGIDFGGAKDTGKKTWITKENIEGKTLPDLCRKA